MAIKEKINVWENNGDKIKVYTQYFWQPHIINEHFAWIKTNCFNPQLPTLMELPEHLLDPGLLLDCDHRGAGQLLGALDCLRSFIKIVLF